LLLHTFHQLLVRHWKHLQTTRTKV